MLVGGMKRFVGFVGGVCGGVCGCELCGEGFVVLSVVASKFYGVNATILISVDVL